MVGRSAGINTDTAMTCAFQRKRECECDSDSDSDCDWDWERGLPVGVVRSELPPPMLAPCPIDLKAKIIMPNNFRRFLLAAVDDGVLALTLNVVCVFACVCVRVCVSRGL